MSHLAHNKLQTHMYALLSVGLGRSAGIGNDPQILDNLKFGRDPMPCKCYDSVPALYVSETVACRPELVQLDAEPCYMALVLFLNYTGTLVTCGTF